MGVSKCKAMSDLLHLSEMYIASYRALVLAWTSFRRAKIWAQRFLLPSHYQKDAVTQQSNTS